MYFLTTLEARSRKSNVIRAGSSEADLLGSLLPVSSSRGLRFVCVCVCSDLSS